MPEITVEHNVSPAKLDILAVEIWPKWSKEVSVFDWTYDKKESCYILKGEAVVTTKDGSESVTIKRGDLVIFSKGLECTWDIRSDIEKHYLLQD